MNGLLTVLPVILPDKADRCIHSLVDSKKSSGLELDELLVVDNTQHGYNSQHSVRMHRDLDGHNLGVAKAWNVGAREVLDQGLDYLVLLSASVEFGPLMHTTWKEQMETYWGSHLIEAMGHSWHLIALHRRVFETIGLFDENFYPAYFEAIDFGYRMRTCGVMPWYETDKENDPELGLEQNYESVWANVMSWGTAQHLIIDCPAPPLLDYYRQKWGGDKGHEQYTEPFNNDPELISHWDNVPIPELATRYELKEWW